MTAGIDRIKGRIEKYGDNVALVIESAHEDDVAFKDKAIDALQTQLSEKKKKGDDGEDDVTFDSSDDPEVSSFQAEVDKKVAGGSTRMQALSDCAEEFPKLHEQYNISQTNARK